MATIAVKEGHDFELSELQAQRLRNAVARLNIQLHPRLPLLTERGGLFRLNNLLGSVDIGGGDLIEVSPKVPTDGDWTTATVSLLTGREAIDVGGERRAGVSALHNRLLDGIAAIFHNRLERAFQQDGPIVLLERIPRELPYLHGTLNVTSWTRKALWRPHIFPVSRIELASDNPFTHGLIRVSNALARIAVSVRVRTGLRALSRDLSPGVIADKFSTVGIASRILPEQWSAYKPAWSLAVAVLTKTSLFGPTGTHKGIGIAVEAWPLLETLLERTLQAVGRVGLNQGRILEYRMKGRVPLLTETYTPHQPSFSPEPDGRLFENGNLVATFEAKYSKFDGKVPSREHIYQALSTAAACGSTVAVMVYPGDFKVRTWHVHGFSGKPMHLLALGLDMFALFPPDQIDARGKMVLTALASINTDKLPTIHQEQYA